MVSMSVSDHLDLSDLEKREAMANLIEFELCDFWIFKTIELCYNF